MSEKLQKILAQSGLGSRRTMEKWIAAGRISVNGTTAKLGDRVTPTDKISVDGTAFVYPSEIKTRVLLYHKPVGEICTRYDSEGRPTIFRSLPSLDHGKWINIGRLDINTSGLLLVTNDGELAHRLTHPSYQVEREYAVRILGVVDQEALKRLCKGVKLEDGLARFDKIVEGGGKGSNHWYRVIVKEGRNRLVRRLWESQGVKVSRLMRVRFHDIRLPQPLKPGKWLELNDITISKIKENLNKNNQH